MGVDVGHFLVYKVLYISVQHFVGDSRFIELLKLGRGNSAGGALFLK